MTQQDRDHYRAERLAAATPGLGYIQALRVVQAERLMQGARRRA